MKWYHHSIIIFALILFIVFFYKDGFGSFVFFIAAIYFAIVFLAEIKRQKDMGK